MRKKLKGADGRKWTDADETNAKAVLKDLGHRIQKL